MAYFNEENTVEQMLINAAGRCGWIYVEPQAVPRLPDEVLVTEWLFAALLRLNPITEEQAAQDARTYVINTRSGVFHYPTCDGVKEMSEHNKKTVTATRSELTSQGYTPCGACEP